jgi:hypothetical protein
MSAWMAGIQLRKDASGDIHVTWIPALHAGMTTCPLWEYCPTLNPEEANFLRGIAS